MLQVHRQVTVIITVCILAHPIVLMLRDSRHLALLDLIVEVREQPGGHTVSLRLLDPGWTVDGPWPS